MKIDYSGCYEEWSEILVKEILSHLNIPDHKEFETELCVEEMSEKCIDIFYEYYDEVAGCEEEECGYNDGRICIRYWIDEEWPSFCVSYMVYDEFDDERKMLDEGAYKIVKRRGKGKCIPLNY